MYDPLMKNIVHKVYPTRFGEFIFKEISSFHLALYRNEEAQTRLCREWVSTYNTAVWVIRRCCRCGLAPYLPLVHLLTLHESPGLNHKWLHGFYGFVHPVGNALVDQAYQSLSEASVWEVVELLELKCDGMVPTWTPLLTTTSLHEAEVLFATLGSQTAPCTRRLLRKVAVFIPKSPVIATFGQRINRQKRYINSNLKP